MILLTKAFLHDRFSYSNRICFSKKVKKVDSLGKLPSEWEQKVIRFSGQAEKNETTNEDFVNESFLSRSL